MESILNYYYGIICNKIEKKDNYYIIKSEDATYLFGELFDNIEEVLSIIDILNKTPIKYHLLVMNKEGKLFITYEGKKYCLFKVRANPKEKINLFTFTNTKTSAISNWANLWSNRIDYYENQVEELIKEPNIKYALQYYIGLTEIAISYCNNLNELYTNNELTYTISHKTMKSPVSYLDYYNPLNMIKDIEVRDLAEYFKMSYFNDVLTESELLSLIDSLRFNEAMSNYFFLRLLYPSYFFNLYDEYIESKELNDEIFECIKKSKDYESLLLKVYSRLKTNNDIKINIWFFKSLHL